jgi:23S rRNA pseudouridine1911/1915/1917 synthase
METSDKRLDLYCAEIFGLTRNLAQRLIKEGRILVNGNTENSKYQVKIGDNIIYTNEVFSNTVPQIPILYEDDSLFLINKPTGISVHPSSGDKDITLTEVFSAKIYDPTQPERPGVVHRLDKGTSGVMIFAKNPISRVFLQKQFKSRKVKKTYIALVEGRLDPTEGVIDIPIMRDQKRRSKMTVSAIGRESRTNYKVISYFNDYSFVEVKPFTGRTHQIRIHFSAIGNPIVGDIKYGCKSDIINRIFLHSARIEFVHPTTKEKVFFEAEIPKELKDVLKDLGDI